MTWFRKLIDMIQVREGDIVEEMLKIGNTLNPSKVPSFRQAGYGGIQSQAEFCKRVNARLMYK